MTNYVAQSVTLGQTFVNTILDALLTRPAGALIVTGKLRLSKDPSLVITPQSTRAALAANEADYSGYTAGGIAAVVSAPVNLSNNAHGVLVQGLFEATTATPFVSANVTGWWIDDGTNLIAGERFSGNQIAAFAAVGAYLSLTAMVPLQLIQGTI